MNDMNTSTYGEMLPLHYKLIYKRAYRIIGDETPLGDADCGKLCGKICCRQIFEDDENGMLLYPGEEAMYEDAPGWMHLKKVNYRDNETTLNDNQSALFDEKKCKPTYLLICNGKCDRDRRPLACRVFPLIPVFNSHLELLAGKEPGKGSADKEPDEAPISKKPADIISVSMDKRGAGICPLVFAARPEDLERSFIRRVGRVYSYLAKYEELKEYMIDMKEHIEKNHTWSII